MHTHERFARHAWALSFLSACAPLPSELEAEGACGPEVELPAGVTVAAASDEFTVCSSCEPQCFRASDTLRSWDVEQRGSNGMVFAPSSGGAENRALIEPCEEPPCGVVYSTGATYTRLYDGAYDNCAPGDVLWWGWGWSASVPEGTHITFDFRTAPSPRTLAEAVPAIVEIGPTTMPGGDLSDVFRSADIWRPWPFLEVRAVLHASVDRRRTPTLYSFYVEHSCVYE